ncbi:hypothetical protein [Dehalobacter sp.]|uniref:hypothetical protein n=1 Tax=Dehalobacter sp. TaxID=1962289 RepID=UPI002589A9BB|nr:hypothetical protein [Dehalobacter sp.]MDJ0305366.1 hypothetical protein [Dehalobacter sp.]
MIYTPLGTNGDKEISNKIDEIGFSDRKHSGVQTSFLPESFEWIRPVSGKTIEIGCNITLARTYVKLSAQAIEESGFVKTDKVAIGINKAFVAFRKDEKGFNLKNPANSKSQALLINSKLLANTLISLGFERGESNSVSWDPGSQMLIAKIPKKQQVTENTEMKKPGQKTGLRKASEV